MTPLDPTNPVVRLCAEGMAAEAEHRHDDARDLFRDAWEASADDYEACIAAHYLARHQPSAQDTLRWNQEALDRARAVTDERALPFYASLYLNLGKSHEDLGDLAEARRCYELAAQSLRDVPESPYRAMVEGGVTRALDRTA